MNATANQASCCSSTATHSQRCVRHYQPAVDIVEEAGELRIFADLPGVAADAVDINFADGVLTLSGKAPARRAENASSLREEYGVGDFSRTFNLSDRFDASKIFAEMKDGVLTVHLPKVDAVKSRKIDVQVK